MTSTSHMLWGEPSWLRTDELTWKAKGLLVYLANQRQGVPLTLKQLLNDGAEGTTSVRAGLEELETRGYIRNTGQPRRRRWELTPKATG